MVDRTALIAEDPASSPDWTDRAESPPMRSLVTAVFSELNRRQIRWALLRAPLASTTPPTGDIDVLVHAADRSAVEAIFRDLQFVRLPRSGIHFLRYDAPSDQWIWFHIVCELNFGSGMPVTTGAAHACLARRSVTCDPPRLAPEDAFWVLLLHCAFDKRRLSPRHAHTLQELAPPDPDTGALAAFVARLCAGASTPALIVEMIRRGDWAGVEQTMSAVEREWAAQHRATPRRRIQARVRRAVRALGRARSRRGLSVALLGPDGAGKSTLASAIAASFQLPVSVMYMGLTGGALKHVARLRIPGVVFAGRALVIWQRYLRSRLHQAQGRLVVFDRYVLDAAVPHPRRLNRVERLSRWLDGYLCPSPDLVLILDAPGEVMHQRKGEYSPEVLEDWRQHFLALRDRLGQVEVIDATRDKETVRIDALDRIWRQYHTRWGRA